ncbi:hypothetical protein JCM10213_004877 [Rhodosporidiobolus nylandii]
MAGQNGVNGTSTSARERTSRSPSPFNPLAFQASLDDSIRDARALVEGWLPAGLGGEWDAPGGSVSAAQGVQSLKDRARLPRLGLGASPAALHQQQAEDRALAKQLGINKARALGDEGSTVRATSTPGTGVEGAMDEDEEEESEDEEESRAKAVLSKARMAPNNPFMLPSSSATTNGAGKKGKKAAKSSLSAPASPPSAGKPLFNAPSPAKPSASSSSTPAPAAKAKNGALTANAFYSPSPSTSAPSLEGLTKNQRKKLRDKQKAESAKRAREEESQREAQAEAGREGEAAEQPEPAAKKARLEEAEGGDAEMHDAPSAPVSPAKSAAGGEGEGEKKKKKKKRKSKGGAQASGEEPVLNLGATEER